MGGAVGVVSQEVGVANSSQIIGNDSTLRRAVRAWGYIGT